MICLFLQSCRNIFKVRGWALAPCNRLRPIRGVCLWRPHSIPKAGGTRPAAHLQAFDPQGTGRMSIDFSQLVYCAANTR